MTLCHITERNVVFYPKSPNDVHYSMIDIRFGHDGFHLDMMKNHHDIQCKRLIKVITHVSLVIPFGVVVNHN